MSSAQEIPEDVLATLAHELNTPISVIVGYAELLESRAGDATTREVAAQIKEAGERLRAAVDRLLADARTA